MHVYTTKLNPATIESMCEYKHVTEIYHQSLATRDMLAIHALSLVKYKITD